MHEPVRRAVEVVLLDARRLLEERRLAHVRGVRDELPDAAVLEREVAADRAGLVEDEAVVVDVRHEPERLLCLVRARLVLVPEDVDDDHLVRDAQLLQHAPDGLRARERREPVEFDDHGDGDGARAGVCQATTSAVTECGRRTGSCVADSLAVLSVCAEEPAGDEQNLRVQCIWTLRRWRPSHRASLPGCSPRNRVPAHGSGRGRAEHPFWAEYLVR